MNISFTVSKTPNQQQQENILQTIGKYDPDYAALLAHTREHMKNQIDWRMAENLSARYRLSPDIDDAKTRPFIFELMQKTWCWEIFAPNKPAKQPMYSGTLDEATISQTLLDFMCSAGGYDENLRWRVFKNGAEVAQAIKPHMGPK